VSPGARDRLARARSPETPAQRSAIMRAVKSRDTTPERKVRALLSRFAPGYRLHRKDVPGNPDIAYVGRRLAIFVHGCFWHGHDCARGARLPKANADYWRQKIARNVARDAAHREKLAAQGWKALTIWECELKDEAALEARLRQFLK
jgi:DNA mismatch endonuclease (patch repair protein)